MILRDYQERAVAAVRQAFAEKCRAPLLVAPTGSGKTICFASISHSAAARGKRIYILVHRQELIDQVDRALTAFDVAHGFIAADYEPKHATVQVASVQTLVRRLGKIPAPDLAIIDEAHHAGAATYGKIIAAYPNTKLLGVTASPVRVGGQGLGDIFDRLIMGPSVKELTAAGHLAPARLFAPPTISTDGMHTLMGEFVKSEVSAAVDKPKVTGDAIDHYQRLTPHRRAIVFCVSLEHAAHLSKAARDAGIRAVQIDGQMDRYVRRQVVDDFRDGKIEWLVSVDLLQEGFDAPGAEVGILLRPTQSLGLYLQQVGRILRPAPGKTEAVILDHAGNCMRFGLPDEDREWKLESNAEGERKAKEKAEAIAVCVNCFSAQPPAPACIYCGKSFPVKSRKVETAKGELKEITAEEIAARRERQAIGRAAHAKDRAALLEIARINGYKPRWVEHRLAAAARKQRGHA